MANGSKDIPTLTKIDYVQKLLFPPPFSGDTFCAQRHFKKVPSEAGGKTVFVYNERRKSFVRPFCLMRNICRVNLLRTNCQQATGCPRET